MFFFSVSMLAQLHTLMTSSALVGGIVKVFHVCVMTGRKGNYLLIVVGFSVH